jgi:hypothetical protein
MRRYAHSPRGWTSLKVLRSEPEKCLWDCCCADGAGWSARRASRAPIKRGRQLPNAKKCSRFADRTLLNSVGGGPGTVRKDNLWGPPPSKFAVTITPQGVPCQRQSHNTLRKSCGKLRARQSQQSNPSASALSSSAPPSRCTLRRQESTVGTTRCRLHRVLVPQRT